MGGNIQRTGNVIHGRIAFFQKIQNVFSASAERTADRFFKETFHCVFFLNPVFRMSETGQEIKLFQNIIECFRQNGILPDQPVAPCRLRIVRLSGNSKNGTALFHGKGCRNQRAAVESGFNDQSRLA
nr:MAG TPA: hypothetical protein [Caudoviricetes sp.]